LNPEHVSVLKRNLDEVASRVEAAATRGGRRASDVRLVVVTKTVGPRIIESLFELGVRDVGESRVQAALGKAQDCPQGLSWHMIGHIQTNKARKVIGFFSMVHSLDSAKLAESLENEASARGMLLPVLVQVNVAREKTKFGATEDSAQGLLNVLERCPHLDAQGFMTMAPYADDPETVRHVFRGLRELRDRVTREPRWTGRLKHLSMGMSQDFEVAIEEGSDIVRIGTAVFTGLPAEDDVQ
jgi:pyridoxal phosphate enzyme (YggS family)